MGGGGGHFIQLIYNISKLPANYDDFSFTAKAQLICFSNLGQSGILLDLKKPAEEG